MEWTQVVIERRPSSILFQVEDQICEIREPHIFADHPIGNFSGNVEGKFFNGHLHL